MVQTCAFFVTSLSNSTLPWIFHVALSPKPYNLKHETLNLEPSRKLHGEDEVEVEATQVDSR